MASSFEQDQQLFADTILKLQIHSALAKENIKNKKSPVPLLAQSCSLLDNFPTRSQHWTPAQETLINSLKIDSWLALTDACIQANDLIQAESSLHRLSALQEAAAGPLSLRSKANKSSRNKSRDTGRSSNNTSATVATTIPETAHVSDNPPSATSNPSYAEATTEQRQAANDLIQTWEKLSQVYSDMGKQDMANNFAKRSEKMREHLKNQQPQ
ncbi:hypothetical protein BGZ80_010998 [Entomortierella chlamydospora]|uniref:Uncharacterized protein n=1 Tax=Entomortierella chlamydospora TaxID=101097 RepID=A0A9P6N2J4_9FUNG|nr:hypothetical protein BGZ80_010998 [Entomortierella chlamydospora]